MDELDAGFTAFFREEYPSVARSVFLILHDRSRAEEVAQDAFAELYARWRKISRYERPEAWVRRIAIRLAIRVASRDRRRADLERTDAAPATIGAVDLDVVRAVDALPPMQRAAVVLFYFEDRPVEETAHLLGCSASTARVHLHRARKRLAQALGEREVSDVP